MNHEKNFYVFTFLSASAAVVAAFGYKGAYFAALYLGLHAIRHAILESRMHP